MVDFSGKYQFVSSNNFEAILKRIEAPESLIQNLPKATNSCIEIIQSGNDISIHTIGLGNSFETKFTLDQEFEGIIWGLQFKGLVTRDGNKLIDKRSSEKGIITIVRELIGNEITATFTIEDIVATRVYKRI